MKKRRILLIGAGGWGAVHLAVYCAHRRWSLSGVADLNPRVLRRVQRETRLGQNQCFSDPIAAIDRGDYDAIGLTAPNPGRIPVLVRALGTGAPVFAEKPLVHTLADLKNLYRAISRSGSVLMVSQNYRFEPQTRRMAEFIRKRRDWGPLRTVLIDFTRNIRDFDDHPVTRLPASFGLNSEQCIHHYDLMRYLLGVNPLRVRARSRRAPDSPMAGWDTIDAWIDFPESTFVNYHASYYTPITRTPWGGRWTLDFLKGSMTWYPYDSDEHRIEFNSPPPRFRIQPSLRSPGRYYNSFLVGTSFEEFTRALDEGRSPECNLRDNAQSLALMWAVERAARTGRPVEFPQFLAKVLDSCP